MSYRTHRWQSLHFMKLKYGHSVSQADSNYEKCLVSLHFENSKYFQGSKQPNSFIFNDLDPYKKKHSACHVQILNRGSTLDHDFEDHLKSEEVAVIPVDISSMSASIKTASSFIVQQDFQRMNTPSIMESFDKIDSTNSYKKLYANEFVEATCLTNLTALGKRGTRCYVLCQAKERWHDISDALEEIKNKLGPYDWDNCRIIVVGEEFNLKNDVLLKESDVDKDSLSSYRCTDKVVEEPRTRKYKDSKYLTKAKLLCEVKEEGVSNSMKEIAKSVLHNIRTALQTATELKEDIIHLSGILDSDNAFEVIRD